MRVAIVSGASSGLGRVFACRLGRREDVEELWVIARREERLKELQALVPCRVRPLPMDLKDPEALKAFQALLAKETPQVRFLVCAAGYGKMGTIPTADLPDELGMVDLNCRAAIAMTGACLPYLSQGSRVLEICSTAAFQPMPGLGVYAATKAFLQSYTKTLHYELLPKGVHVTAVCPYWIKDTEFIPVAREGKPGQFRHFPLASKSSSVVGLSLAASALNLWVVTPGIVCTLHRIAAKFIPHFIMVPLMGLIRRL